MKWKKGDKVKCVRLLGLPGYLDPRLNEIYTVDSCPKEHDGTYKWLYINGYYPDMAYPFYLENFSSGINIQKELVPRGLP